MRFVETKTPEQQSVLMLHRIRLVLVRQRTMLSNTIRAHMAEFGVIAPIGRNGLDQLLAVLSDLDDERVPALARDCLVAVAEQLMLVKGKILDMDRRIAACQLERHEPPTGGDPGRWPAARDRPGCDGP
jgi:transposase